MAEESYSCLFCGTKLYCPNAPNGFRLSEEDAKVVVIFLSLPSHPFTSYISHAQFCDECKAEIESCSSLLKQVNTIYTKLEEIHESVTKKIFKAFSSSQADSDSDFKDKTHGQENYRNYIYTKLRSCILYPSSTREESHSQLEEYKPNISNIVKMDEDVTAEEAALDLRTNSSFRSDITALLESPQSTHNSLNNADALSESHNAEDEWSVPIIYVNFLKTWDMGLTA